MLDKQSMPRELWIYLGIPFLIGLLFWNPLTALFTFLAGLFFFLYTQRFFHLCWNVFLRWRVQGTAIQESPPPSNPEPTLITLVARAPEELLGVEAQAGTGTIFHSFNEKMKAETDDGLRLTKSGRRLTAAKNLMMQRRRKYKQGKATLDGSLSAFLNTRPVYSGKVFQIKNIPVANLTKYAVGKEIDGINGLAATPEAPEAKAKGNHRLVIHSVNGRLLSDTGEGQVAFFPGTRFMVVSREPWKNPNDTNTEGGFSFELKEVA